MRLASLAALPLVIVALVAVARSADDPVTQTPCGSIRSGGEATSRLQVADNRMQDSGGNAFTPYGVSVVGGPQTVNWARTQKAAAAQITAAHKYWHANTIRIQVSEALLFREPTRGHSYNVAFAKAVDRLVCQVIRQGDVPVLNVTSIFTGRERGPGARTVRFWRFMARRYGNTLPVIFDLFNEPQVTRNPRTHHFLRPADVWRIWRSGGTVGGNRYVGMQDLVDEIRVKQRVGNLIWAEEPYYLSADDARLDRLPDHLLKGADIVYAFHKPNMDQRSRSFRDLRAVAAKEIPLMDSEWGQFAATDRPWMCQPDAYRTAPRYLQFLRDAGIGMLAWSLQPGSLVRGVPGRDTVHDGKDVRFTKNPRELARPSEMKPSYGCTRAARGQGAGRLVMDYFARWSRRPPGALFPELG